MGWGRSSPKVEVKASGVGRQLIPLLIAAVIVAGVAVVGYQIYVSASKIRSTAEQRMARHNMVWTKDGVRVGVRHIKQESYVDQTQSWVVKAWNMGGPSSSSSGDPDAAAVQRKKLKKNQQQGGGGK